jgi:hypothetical protein
MPRSIPRLLGPDATADENRAVVTALYRLEGEFKRGSRSNRATRAKAATSLGQRLKEELQDQITDPASLDEAEQILAKALTDLKKHQIILSLHGVTPEVPKTGNDEPPLPPQDQPPQLSEAALAAAESIDPSEWEAAAITFAALARERAGRLDAERRADQEAVLAAISASADLILATRQKLDADVVRARALGLTWTRIGEAARVRREVAFRRWKNIAEAGESANHPND